MLVDPHLNEIVNGDRGMLKGIDVCIQAECLVSAVGLIYSTIDALSALTRPSGQADTRSEFFIDWVTKYIDPKNTLNCSADDIYGARCGILHNYGLNSRRRRQGRAKALIYKWRDGPDPDPSRTVPLPPDAITICVQDLHRVLREAVMKFLGELQRNSKLKKRVDYHRKNYYVTGRGVLFRFTWLPDDCTVYARQLLQRLACSSEAFVRPKICPRSVEAHSSAWVSLAQFKKSRAALGGRRPGVAQSAGADGV